MIADTSSKTAEEVETGAIDKDLDKNPTEAEPLAKEGLHAQCAQLLLEGAKVF